MRSQVVNEEQIVRSSSVQAIEKTTDYVAPVVAGRPYGEPEQWAAVDIQQILGMLQRRKKVFVAGFLAVLLVAGLYAFTAKHIYESQTTIEVDTQNRNDSSDMGPLSVLMDNGAQSVETQVAILKGPQLRRAAFKKLPRPQQLIAKRFTSVDVAAINNTTLINVTVRTYDRRVSQRLADNICAQYIKDSLEENRDEVRGARVYVEQQLAKKLIALNEAQVRLANFKRQNQTFDLTTQSQALVGRLTAMQTQGDQAKSAKMAALAQIARFRQDSAGMPNSTRMPQTITMSPEVVAIKAQLTSAELDLVKSRQEYTEGSATIVALKNQIANLKRQLTHRVVFETSAYTDVPNAIKGGILQQIASLKGTVAASDSELLAVQQAMAGAQEELKALPDREYRLGRLIQDADSLKASYINLNEQYGNLQIQEQGKVADARQRFAAEPGILVAPKKARILMLTIPLAFIVAFVLAAFVDRLDGRVHSDAEVESATGLPVLAHVAEISRAEDSKLLNPGGNRENFALAESFQMLRTSISFSVYDKPIRTILISSSLPGEGKSTCAMNLAIASALSGEKVILVDCDLRRPAAHKLMKLPNRVGFTSVVAGKATLEEALQDTAVEGLRVLTSGPIPPNPYLLLHSRGARELLDQLGEQADFVIIDTPPALGMADAQLLASAADAILLVVSTKGAKKYEISRTRDLLGQTGVDVVGTILNRVESTYGGYTGQKTYGAYALVSGEDTEEDDVPENNGASANGALANGANGHAQTPFDKKV